MNSKNITLAALLLYTGYAEAQQSRYFNEKERYKYNLAENLYQTKIYNTSQSEYAQQYFYNQYLSRSQKEAAQFFDNVIGVMLQKNHAEQGLEAFMKEYPKSAYFAQANMPLADYYLASKNFDKALETLKKVNQYQLSRSENAQYIVKLGYSKYMTGDSKGAMTALREVYSKAEGAEKNDIAYMLGHLYYADKQNAKALQYFDAVKNESRYSQLVRPYYVQIYFNEKKYDQAISEGKDLLNSDISEAYKTEVQKIIGESYFMKKDYAQAYPYLKYYIGKQSSPSESDLYEMGFVSAQLGNHDEAVSYYNQLIHSDSPMAQNAYYQLGNSYLAVQKKQEALSAFRSAYQMNYDASVQQLAHEQYAKLSYDIGNPYEGASFVIQNYIDKYPSSPKVAGMKKLLVKSYLYSENYKETLQAIDKLPNSTPETDKIDQEVSFLLGTEEFNKSNFTEAEKYFMRSLELNENKEINSRATYWLAQTYYQLGNFPSAIVRYERVLNEKFPESQQVPYDLAYAYFKSKKFDKAKTYFQKYLTNPKPEFKSDAELRLADIHYVDNDLNEAIAIYEKTGDVDDYTMYQKAMALGFKGDTQAKINSLKAMISKYGDSEYRDDAEYEIGTAYAAQDDFANSNAYFSKVISNSKDSDLVANAKIYTAQNYIELNQADKALSEFKTLGNEYKGTAYAQKIVQAVRPLYIKNGDVAGYKSFAQSIGVNLETSEIDAVNLTTAQNYYAKKDYKNAISYYEKYLIQNPNGEGSYQAKYEMGESLYQTKNTTKALLVLQDVAGVANDYQNDAQTRIAQIYIAQNDIQEARPYLENIKNSSDVNIRNFAGIELMKIYAKEKNFSEAEKMTDAVLANSKNSAAVKESAKAIKARIQMLNGKDKDAQTAYSALEKSSNTEVAAEALYAKAFYQNKAKAYKTSNETIFKLAGSYASEEYWGAKALVLMAKNYIGLKDNYQASYTCDQIISNYGDFPEIVNEAREVKKQIK